MSEQNTATEVDPLSQAAGGINTDFPLLMPDRIYRLEIKSGTKEVDNEAIDKKSKTKYSREQLLFKLATTQDAMSRDGKPLRAGFTLRKYLLVTPTGDYTLDSVARSIAILLKACGKANVTPRELINNPSMLDKQVVDAKVGISVDKTGTYPDSNSITFVIPADA